MQYIRQRLGARQGRPHISTAHVVILLSALPVRRRFLRPVKFLPSLIFSGAKSLRQTSHSC